MSDHDKAMEDYQKEQERQRRLYATAMSKLLPDQREAIHQSWKAMADALQNISEMNDLWLSDIRKLEDSCWSLRHKFNLGDK